MTKALVLAAVVVAAVMVAAGCGDSEPQVCEDLRDVQSSVREIRDVELEEGAGAELQERVGELRTGIAAVKESGGEELGDEIDAFERALEALTAEIEAVAAEGDLSREDIRALAPLASGALDSGRAVAEAAPDCDL